MKKFGMNMHKKLKLDLGNVVMDNNSDYITVTASETDDM
jgi:hypothetical protein